MGYTTKFIGAIKLSRSLTMAEAKQILEANEDSDTIEGDKPARSYMQWVPTETLNQIVWDGEEKFYDYPAWMQWICDLLKSWGIGSNGQLRWSGESTEDTGTLIVQDGVVSIKKDDTPEATSFRPLTMRGLQAMALKQITSS